MKISKGVKRKEVLFLLIILAIAVFFRLWRLSSIPPGFYPDEAINGNEAITIPGKIFYPENNGREGLFINLVAVSFSIFGASIWSLRLVSAIIGILTVLGLYLLTKELFNKESIALLSSFFLAISFWHINFSRITFRGILLPFILVFGFFFLLRGFRTKKICSFIISGIFFGLGFYTYISYRFVVLLLLPVLISFWFVYKKQNLEKQFLLFTAYCLLFTVIVALPIGIYFLRNPHNFIGRAMPISIFAAQNPIKEFGKSLVLHLGMFNFYGDPNWRHNLAGSPMLFWPIGILFLIGIAVSIRELMSSMKNKSLILNTSYLILVAWFFIMLLPGILTYEGTPHSLRAIGAIPAVYVLAALGGCYLYNWLNNRIKDTRFLIVLCSLFFVLMAFAQFQKYFFCWGQQPEVENAFSKDYLEIGNYLNSLPPSVQKYVIVNQPGVPIPWPDGIPVPAQTPMFMERTKFGQVQSIYLLPNELDKITVNKKTTIIVPMKYDEELFNELSQRFPEGRTEIEPEKGIWFYNINLEGYL